jgi:hypothetical protein
MSDSNLVKVPIVDKNGKSTTVHKRDADADKGKSRIGSVGAPKSNQSDNSELAAEIDTEISKVQSQLDVISAKIKALQDEANPLVEQRSELIDMKMEAEAGKITTDSPIEDIQALNDLAFSHSSAAKNEKEWVRAINPRFRTSSYDQDNRVPILQMDFAYEEAITDDLVEDISTFLNTVANGRDEVSFELLNIDEDSHSVAVNLTDGTATVTRYGRTYWKFGDNPKPLKKTLEWVTKNLPFTVPEGSSYHPDDY